MQLGMGLRKGNGVMGICGFDLEKKSARQVKESRLVKVEKCEREREILERERKVEKRCLGILELGERQRERWRERESLSKRNGAQSALVKPTKNQYLINIKKYHYYYP